MGISSNEALAGENIGVDEKVSVRQGFDTFLCIRMMLGSKHAKFIAHVLTPTSESSVGSYNIVKAEKEYYNRHMRRAPDDGI